jgi:hypothetical protein
MVDTLIDRGVVVRNPKGDTLTLNVFNYKGEQTYKVLFLFNDLKQCIGYQGYNKDGKYSGGSEIKFDKLNMPKRSATSDESILFLNNTCTNAIFFN